ncbi:stage II sporulation protein R [Cohnella boryungensis]|uniref:Stage II sporulation protein R n=1 Tax=Cohnella boryungensis TaxID=768479 RepID=A0ABV8SAL1_9BACL
MRMSPFLHLSFCRLIAKAMIIAILSGFILISLSGRYVNASAGEPIPEDAIRIRIIANSDSAEDQAVKNKVRAQIAAYIRTWGGMPETHDEAYELIESRLPRIQRLVDKKLNELKAPYEGVAELGVVPFPEKSFEDAVYEAGNYEALRITLGDGSGANWWCVLFPPLCLTAATAKEDKASGNAVKSASSAEASGTQAGAEEAPKAKFFLWELLQQLFSFIASLFS